MKKANTNTIPQCTAEFRAEMKKIFGSPDFGSKDFRAYMTPSGHIYEVRIPRIKTNLCFGYSDFGKDTRENARRLMEESEKNPDCFVRENVLRAEFMFDYDLLTGADSEPTLRQREGSNIVYLIDLHGTLPKFREIANGLIELSPEDKEFILAVLEQEKAMFEKRLQAYLKRYGLSKVHTWTYWRD